MELDVLDSPVRHLRKTRSFKKKRNDDALVAEFMSYNCFSIMDFHDESLELTDSITKIPESAIEAWLTSRGVKKASIEDKKLEYFERKKTKVQKRVYDSGGICSIESMSNLLSDSNSPSEIDLTYSTPSKLKEKRALTFNFPLILNPIRSNIGEEVASSSILSKTQMPGIIRPQSLHQGDETRSPDKESNTSTASKCSTEF